MKTARPQQPETVDQLLEAIGEDAFECWYHEWQVKQAFRDGDAWKQTPQSLKPPTQHAPSKLRQCHRKTFYTAHNTPKEKPDPAGIFWAGTRIEEDIVQPFLEDLATAVPDDPVYVQNSMWVDYQVPTDVGELEIRGATDPVVCTPQGEPLLPTEVKAKKSLDTVDKTDPEPATHHRAQLHAYLYGLNQQVSHTVRTGLIIYVDRQQHNLIAMEIDFDPEFWESQILSWARTQTEYRLDEVVPPATPEFDWECTYCPFTQRCGQGDGPYADLPATGFVPLRHYPREQVTAALEADGGASELTPTLAHQYPELAADNTVSDWQCSVCGEQVAYAAVDWDGNLAAPPTCPACATVGRPAELHGPIPGQEAANE